MGQVNISVNGRAYDIACDNGQEEHLERLATVVDERVAGLVTSVGQAGDARLLVMASLLIADELAEAYGDLAKLKDENKTSGGADRAAEKLNALAARIEGIADRLISA